MIADNHDTRTTSGASTISLLAAWHVDNAGVVAAAVNIRERDAAGRIVVPLHIPAGSSVGNEYAHPLNVDGGGPWYVEIVAGASVTVSLSGRK